MGRSIHFDVSSRQRPCSSGVLADVASPIFRCACEAPLKPSRGLPRKTVP